eukprot:TRINITY_DN8984_c0_g1_i5.p2 TRINITY_DN8984_c0_g1~~TRINITY_DN8984_c0_g1_i5.p2  ORF type:complete len:344 (-),score=115.07 TRINITY_DN8984_c0_g1_i5:170-1201(-)
MAAGSSTLERVTLGSGTQALRDVSHMGLGCMGMSFGLKDHSRTPEEVERESREVIERALGLGVNFFDTAAVYAYGVNERLLGSTLRELPYKREEYVVATKCGFTKTFAVCGTPDSIKKTCDECLANLGTPYIDLFYLHRKDPDVPIEESMKAMAELYKEGKIRAVGLSEVKPETLRRAHAVFPVTALQNEYSLFFRDNVEQNMLPVCRELGISLVPYSPLGHGFLSGGITSRGLLEQEDWRLMLPRFTEENIRSNLELVRKLQDVADRKHCTTAQLALAWVLAQGKDVVPIPGTKRIKYLEANVAAASVRLGKEDLSAIDEITRSTPVQGDRYPPRLAKLVWQ